MNVLLMYLNVCMFIYQPASVFPFLSFCLYMCLSLVNHILYCIVCIAVQYTRIALSGWWPAGIHSSSDQCSVEGKNAGVIISNVCTVDLKSSSIFSLCFSSSLSSSSSPLHSYQENKTSIDQFFWEEDTAWNEEIKGR